MYVYNPSRLASVKLQANLNSLNVLHTLPWIPLRFGNTRHENMNESYKLSARAETKVCIAHKIEMDSAVRHGARVCLYKASGATSIFCHYTWQPRTRRLVYMIFGLTLWIQNTTCCNKILCTLIHFSCCGVH